MNLINDLKLTVLNSKGEKWQLSNGEANHNASVKWSFKDAYGVTACYVDGFCRDGFDYQDGISLFCEQKNFDVEYLSVYMFSMFCLAVCDACVGIRCFPTLEFMTPELSHFALTLTWIAYVPSLILLLATTDALNFKDKSEKELIHN